MSIPPDITLEANSSDFLINGENDPSVTGQVTATDLIDPSPLVTFSDVNANHPDPQTLKVITRTWTATDSSGNSVSETQIITVESASIVVLYVMI